MDNFVTNCHKVEKEGKEMFKISKDRELAKNDIIGLTVESNNGDITASVEIDRDVYFSNLTEDELDDIAAVTIIGLEYDFISDKWKSDNAEIEVSENEVSYQKCILNEAENNLIYQAINAAIYNSFGKEQREVYKTVQIMYDKKMFFGETFITDALFNANKELVHFLRLNEYDK